MKGKMVTIFASGEQRVEIVDLASPPGLELLQSKVGGFIEAVPGFVTWLGVPCVAYCNEEGKLNDLPVNPTATFFWHMNFPETVNDVLAGDVVILSGDDEFMEAL